MSSNSFCDLICQQFQWIISLSENQMTDAFRCTAYIEQRSINQDYIWKQTSPCNKYSCQICFMCGHKVTQHIKIRVKTQWLAWVCASNWQKVFLYVSTNAFIYMAAINTNANLEVITIVYCLICHCNYKSESQFCLQINVQGQHSCVK